MCLFKGSNIFIITKADELEKFLVKYPHYIFLPIAYETQLTFAFNNSQIIKV